MGHVYITKINSLYEYDDRYEIVGRPKYIYYIEAKEIEEVLMDYVRRMNKFPIYLTAATYHDYDDFEALLKRLGQEYEINALADVAYASTSNGGMLRYHVPLFKVKITDQAAFETIIRESFWMAESNCTWILSFSDNVSFENRMGKDLFGKEAGHSAILIDMATETAAIGIGHDASGFMLYSNLEENKSINMIAQLLPCYTIVTGK